MSPQGSPPLTWRLVKLPERKRSKKENKEWNRKKIRKNTETKMQKLINFTERII